MLRYQAAAPLVDPLDGDGLIDAAKEVRIRQDLALTALGKRPADKALRVGRLLDVHTRTWREDWEIVIKGRRIAWVGPAGEYHGEVGERFHEPDALRRARLRRGAQAYREFASDAGMGGGAGAAARQHLDLRGEPRILQRQRPAQSRILAGGAQARLAAEDLPAARLRRAAHRL